MNLYGTSKQNAEYDQEDKDMFFNGKEYFVDFKAVDGEKKIITFRNLDEVRYFVEEGLDKGTINEDEKYRICLSEKNYDTEVKEDAFWEGVEIDFRNLDKTFDEAAEGFAQDFVFNVKTDIYNNLDPVDIEANLAFIHRDNDQEIVYSKTFKDMAALNEFIRNVKKRIDTEAAPYTFSAQIRPKSDFYAMKQYILARKDIEPDTLRPFTPEEIVYLYLAAYTARFDYDEADDYSTMISDFFEQ